MVRKSNSRRKGMQPGVQRGIKTKPTSVRKSSSKLVSVLERRIEKLTIAAYGMVIRVCIAMNLVPFTKTLEGVYEVKAKNELNSYKIYKMITGVIAVHRCAVALNACTKQEFTTAALLSVVEAIGYTAGWIISVYNASETATLLNKFNMIIAYLQAKRCRELTMFGDLRLSLKVISTVLMIPMIILTTAVANGLLFGGLSTSFIRLADVVIDISSEDRIWWQLLFLPLEIISVFTVLMTACVVCVSAFTALHISKTFGEQIRDMKVVDLASRDEVERMYICWELYEKMSRRWLMPHTTAIIASISCGAIINIFVAIKYTNLPTLIHSAETIVGPSLLFLLAVGMYDAVKARQLSEGVLTDQLKDFAAPGFGYVTLRDRREMLKKVKTMSPITVPIGTFTNVQFSVMVAVWEEIINQILFLLSL